MNYTPFNAKKGGKEAQEDLSDEILFEMLCKQAEERKMVRAFYVLSFF